nr:Calx-beta domain-containing protein [Pedobacter sp. SYSU D00823]
MNVELRKADLQVVSITPGKTSYCVGEEITYNVKLKNAGPDDVTGAKFTLAYPSSFQFTGVTALPTVGVSSNYGNTANSTQFSTTVDMKNGAELTLQVKGKTTVSGSLSSVTASILRPADVTDPDATNPDSAPPTDAALECSAGCNNIKTSSNLTITTVGISILDASVTEKTAALSEISFTVSIPNTTGCDVSANYTLSHITTNTADFDSSVSGTGTVTIPANSKTATVKFLLNADRVIEGNETFRVTLSNPSGGYLNTNFATGTIVNDDIAELFVTTTNGTETGTVPAKVNFRLTTGVTSDVDTEIDYVLNGDLTAGLDFTGTGSGTIKIPAGENEITLTLPAIDDEIVEGDEVSKVALTRLYNSHANTVSNATTIAPEVKISDNDNANLNLGNDIVLNEGNTGTINATFSLRLNKETSKKFTLNYRTDDGSARSADNDYVSSGTVSLEFLGVKDEEKFITVPIIGDKKIEGSESFKLNIFNLSDSFGGRLTIPKDIANADIVNDDSGQITVSSEDGEEGVKSGSFTFSLPSGVTTDIPLTINYTLSGDAKGGGLDYSSAVTGSVIIPAGQNNVTLVLPVIDDAVAEGSESVLIAASVEANTYSIGLTNPTKSLTITDNDKALITVSPVSVTEGNSGTKTVSFEVKLNVATADGFSLKYKTADGTAKSGEGDYTAIPASTSATLNFNGTAGESHTIDIIVNADQKIEGDETFNILLESVSPTFGNSLSLFNTTATATILDDDSGIISILATNGSENGPQNGKFEFRFSNGVSSDKTTHINFEFDGAGAEAGVDFTPSNAAFVEIPAGQQSVVLSLQVNDDLIVEGEEKVRLKNVSLVSDYSRVSLNTSIPEASIEDNDAATLSLSGPGTITETSGGQTTASFTVKLDKPVSKSFSITYNTIDGVASAADNDYISTSGILTFNGTAGETQTISVTINGDKKVEADEDFQLQLSQLSNTFGNKLTIPISLAVCTIKNDDAAQVAVSAAPGAEGMYNASITFSLNNGISDKPTAINYTLSGTAISGADYDLPIAGTAIIPAGSSSITIPVPVTDDDIVENTEDIVVSASIGSNVYGFTFANSSANLNILDNDQGIISISSPVSITEGNSGANNLEFEVSLNKAISKTVTLQYKTADLSAIAGSDYIARTGILTFTVTPGAQTQKISVPVTGDLSIEPDETFSLSLSNLSESFGGQLTTPDPNAIGRIKNDDGGDIAITHKDGGEGAQTPEFRFSFPIGYSSSQPTVIQYTLTGDAVAGTDYSGVASSVTIPAGSNSVTLSLSVVDDAIVELDESVELNVISVSNGMTMSNTFDKLVIEDNDLATLSLSAPAIVTETNSGTTTATYTVTLNKATSKSFSVDYLTSDGTALVSDNDYLPAHASLSFTGKNAGETQSFNVVINGDSKIEKDETFKVELSNISQTFKDKLNADRLSFALKTSSGTIKNDDAATIAITGDKGKEGLKGASFTFTLSQGTADEDITVPYTLTGDAGGAGIDYSGNTTGSITILAGKNSAVLELPVIDDTILEDLESITLSASGVSSSYPVSLSNPTETTSIEDNDKAIISLAGVSLMEGDDGVKTASFTISLDSKTSKGFDLDFTTSDGNATTADGDYQSKTGKIHFNGEAGEVQTIDITVNSDRKIESNENFNLLLGNLSYDFTQHLSLASNSAKAMITNDDQSEIVITATNGKEQGTIPGSFEFSFKPGFSSDKDVDIQYTLTGSAAATLDFTGDISGSFRIPAGQTKATLSLPVIDDQIVEGTEDIRLTAGTIVSAYTTSIIDGSKTLQIEDNDEATVTISSDVTITEGNNGQKTASFTVGPDRATASGFTLTYSTADITAKTADNDYIAISGTLTFSGSLNDIKTVSIPVNGDGKIETDESFRFNLGTLTSPFGARIKVPVTTRTVTIQNDDTANLMLTTNDGEEGLNNASFTIGYENGLSSDVPVRVDYFLTGTAKSNEDYTGANSFIDIPAGQNSVTVNLPVIDDAVVEDTEIVEVTATARSNSHGIKVVNSPQSLKIADNDKALVSISPVTILEGNNGTRTASFDVKLDVATAEGFTIKYKTVDGTATSADADYVPTTSTQLPLSFTGSAGETHTIEIPINSDQKIEADETFTVELNAPSVNFGNTLRLANTSATTTIVNDDSGDITITASDFREDNPGMAELRFNFPAGVTSDQPTRVSFKLDGDAEGGKDYTSPAQNWIEIPAGQPGYTLSIPVIDDNILEEEEKIILRDLTLSNSSGLVSLATSSLEIPVIDNDAATLTLSGPVSLDETSTGQTTATFTVVLNNPVSKAFSITYSTQDGNATSADNDYVAASGTLTFNGSAGESKTITVVVNGDRKVEADESFTLKLSQLSNSFANALTVPVTQTSCTLKNDDSAEIVIAAANGKEGAYNASLSFSLSNGAIADKPTIINYTLSGSAVSGSDYSLPVTGTATIDAGKRDVTISIPVTDDDIIENTEDIKVAITVNSIYGFAAQNSPASLDIIDNDQATIAIVSPVSVTEGSNGTVDLVFDVMLNKELGKAVTIKYQTVDGTAVAGSDYIAKTGILNFTVSPGAQTQKISIPVTGDLQIEADETFKIQLSDLSENFGGKLIIMDPNATGRILNDDGGNISITHKDGAEAGDTPEFIFSFPAGTSSSQPTVIQYSLEGSANSADYTGSSGFITIPAGVNSVSLPLTVNDDAIVEKDETVELTVNSIDNGLTMANTYQQLTIEDNDVATLTLSAPVIATETNSGTTTASYTVTLDKATSKTFSIDYATADGTALVSDNDYLPVNAQLSFTGQNPGETQSFTVIINGDTKIEKDEAFKVLLSNITETFKDRLNADRLSFVIDNATTTIKNDDAATIAITGENGAEGIKGGLFLFSLSQGTADEDIKVSYNLTGDAVGDGTDYIGSSTGEVTIPAGLSSVELKLPVVDDLTLEDAESLMVNATSVSSSYPITLSNQVQKISIDDNDLATLTLSGVNLTEGDDGVKTASFTLSLDNATSRAFNLNYSTADGTATVADGDYVAKSANLQFAGNAAESQIIDIVVNGDRKIESDEFMTLLLSGLSYDYNQRLKLAAASSKATIVNNDQSEIFITVANGKEAGTVPGTFEFSYKPGYSSDKDAVVQYSLAGTAVKGQDFTDAAAGSITIPAGETKAVLSLSVADDQIVEGDEDVKLTAGTITSLNPTSISSPSKTLNIEDNDELTVTLSNDISITEGDNGQKNATFSVSADKESSSGFKLAYSTSDLTAKASDNDYVSNNGILTFSGGLSDVKTITIPINGDTKIEADESFNFNLGAVISPFNNRIKVTATNRTVTIKNDDSGNLVLTKIDGQEGLKDASFNVGFENGLIADVPLRIEYTLGGNAKGGLDYTGTNSVIDIPAGQSSVTVTLPVTDDAVIEDTEKIELETKVQANPYNIGIPANVTSISIADNDNGTLSISPAAINERDAGSQSLSFKVTLDKATEKPFTLQYSTADGSATSASGDYTSTNGTLSFSGAAGESQTISVVVKDDKMIEETETITAKLNSVSNTFNGRLSFAVETAVGTITDDDAGVIQVTKVDGAESGPAPGKFIFGFKGNITADKATSISYSLGGNAAGNGEDYVGATSGTIVIQPGQSAATLVLPVLDDIKVEGNEEIKLLNVVSASQYNAVISVDPLFPDLIVADNDSGTLSFSANVAAPEGNDGTQNAVYTVTLNRPTNTGFDITYETIDGTASSTDGDYIPVIGTLTFAGTAGESKTISIPVKGDKKIEANESFNLILREPLNNFGGLLTIPEKQRTTTIQNDDSGAISIAKTDGVEGGQAASFIFSYPFGITADIPVKIDYSLAGTAKNNGIDYSGNSPAAITIPAGQNSVTLSLPVTDDELVEDKEKVDLSASVSSNAYTIQLLNAIQSTDILDNDNTTISVAPASIAEGDNGTSTLDFKLTLKKATGRPFSLPYQTADDLAKASDNDYATAAVNAAVSFAGTAGETQTISIQVKGDKKIEADETLTLMLKDLSENFNGRLALENTSVTGTILNDDRGAVTITKTDGAETGTVAGSFIFSLPADMTSDQPVLINYSLDGTAGGNGVDYTGATSAAITIPANQNKVTLSLPVINDAIVEEDETVVLNVSSLNSLYNAAVTLNPQIPVMKIMDDDFGDISLGAPVVKPEGNSGTTSFDFPVTLSKATGLPFTLKYSTANGSATVEDNDYIPGIDQVLNFAGQAGEVQTIKVQVKGDLKLEADEIFNLTIHSLSNAFANKLQITNANSTGTIKNDDAGQILVTKTDGTEGLQDAAFTFSYPQNVTSEAPTIITYRLSGTATSADYSTSAISSITIPAGTNSITLPVRITDDNELEDVETISISVESISNSNSLLAWATPLPVININDNDKAEITITGPDPVIEKHNGKTTVTFNVKLDNLTSRGFDVDFRTTNGSASTDDNDYLAKSGTLSFSGFAGETKQITVEVNGDLRVEADELFNMVLSNISPSYGGRLTAKGSPAIAKIINDDFAPVANPDVVTTPEDVAVTFSVTANDTDVDGIDAKTVRIQTPPVKGTLVINTDGTLRYSPLANDYGTYTFTYTVKDNLGLESNIATGIINVTPVNDPPKANDDEFYIAKDAAFRGTVATNDSDVDGDVLKFRLISAPLTGAQLDNFNVSDGSFLYIPRKGFAGIEEFVYEIIDPAGLKDTATVRLKVQGNVTASLTPDVATITEGDSIVVRAVLDDVLLQDVQLGLQYGGSAAQGKDYVLQPQYTSITIPAGAKTSEQKIHVQSLKDYLKEGDENLAIRITSATPSAFVKLGSNANVIIKDFYPEGKPVGPGENDDIVPDPLLSPNNDSQGNEQFVIRNIERYPDNEVIIFNRWGNEVYRIKGYNNSDKAFRGIANSGIGSNANATLTDGVYYFIIHTKVADGSQKSNKGYVILKR